MDMQVLQVVPCCTPVGDPSNELVHWRIFLVVRKSPPLAIRADMQPGGSNGRYGQLQLDEVPYLYSQNIAAGTEIDAKPNSTYGNRWSATTFRTMLYDQSLDSYYYAPGPKGCRFWCTMVLRSMEMVGFLPSGSSMSFERYVAAINYQYPRKFPLPLIKGTFPRCESLCCCLIAL